MKSTNKIVNLMFWSCGVVTLLAGMVVLQPPVLALLYIFLGFGYGWWGYKLLCEE